MRHFFEEIRLGNETTIGTVGTLSVMGAGPYDNGSGRPAPRPPSSPSFAPGEGAAKTAGNHFLRSPTYPL